MKKIPFLILIVAIAITGILLSTDGSGATATTAGFAPSALTVQTGQTFYLTATVNDASDLYAWQCDLEYNSEFLEYVGLAEGDLLSSDGSLTYFAAPATEPGKAFHAAATRLSDDIGIDGSGAIAHIYFRALNDTNSTMVNLKDVRLLDRNARDVEKDYLDHGRCRVTIGADAPVYTQPSLSP